MALSQEQVEQILQDGYVQFPGLVPREMVESALRAINHSLGEGMAPEEMTKFRTQSFCPELRKAPVITDLLYKTPALSMAEAAMGVGMVRGDGQAQMALRFPLLERPATPLRPHVDGTYSPNNGVPKTTVGSFTALVGILLSDVTTTDAGNFTVWPGTHLACARYFQEHGPQTLVTGMPPVELPAPRQLTGRAGDVILAHYLLGHSVGPNLSAHVRYALFFRLWHADHHAPRWEALVDPWLEWPAVRETALAAQGKLMNGR